MNARPLLLSLLLLTPLAARADAAIEELYLRRAEMHPLALQHVVGVVTVTAPREGGPALARHVPGAPLTRLAPLPLSRTRAVSGWDADGRQLRRFPVREVRGALVLAVVDARTGESAWLERTGEEAGPDAVHVAFTPLEALAHAEFGVGLVALTDDGQAALHEAPQPDAPALRVSMPPGWDVLRPVAVSGGFVRVGVSRALDEAALPVGWVELFDDAGALALWPVAVDDC